MSCQQKARANVTVTPQQKLQIDADFCLHGTLFALLFL